MENFEKFYEYFIESEKIYDDHYYEFIDQIKIRDLERKIFKLIEEHCNNGFKEWSRWKGNYNNGYETFIRLFKHKNFMNLLTHYNIDPESF